MRNSNPGMVTEGLWYLGREEAGSYLLVDNEESVIINGSCSIIIPDVLEQARRFGIDLKKIDKAIILHAHFDHVGIIPYLFRQNPQLRVLASARAKERLQTPNVIETINTFSQITAELLGKGEEMRQYDGDWRNDIKIETIQDGEEIKVGGRRLLVMETPGHSSCAIAVYEPSLKALFPSDSGGIPFANTIITSGNSNFTKYQAGLRKLATLAVEYYCADHYGFITGEEAGAFGAAACDAAEQLRALIETTLRRLGDVNAASREINNNFYETYPAYFLDKGIMESIVLQMVKHIAKGLA